MKSGINSVKKQRITVLKVMVFSVDVATKERNCDEVNDLLSKPQQ